MILFTDIDGTLLDKHNTIPAENFTALKKLKNTVRVAITGRNLYSTRKVLPENTPIDYLVFSNGAGIIHWQTGKIIYARNLSPEITNQLIAQLAKHKITFTVHKPIPETHYYAFHTGSYIPEDLMPRNKLYEPFVTPLTDYNFGLSTCIICMLSPDPEDFERVKSIINDQHKPVSVTRTTSPVNHRNIWLEIFDRDVNKGKSAEKLCQYLGIPPSQTIGIGNDYNDTSLLDFVAYPFVVENAPADLREKFPVTVHHNDNAIAEVIALMNPD